MVKADTPGVPACSNCGEENSDRARFCLSCGTALAEAPRAERRERRVVSVLFADLAGFTSRSESLDVEDVEGFLAPYLAVLRSEVERTGGVVVKFTGDGVMAIFGAVTGATSELETILCGSKPTARHDPRSSTVNEHVFSGAAAAEVASAAAVEKVTAEAAKQPI